MLIFIFLIKQVSRTLLNINKLYIELTKIGKIIFGCCIFNDAGDFDHNRLKVITLFIRQVGLKNN